MADIHGMYRALRQVLDRAGFDPERDELVSLGDLADRGPDSREVLDFLAGLPRFRFVLGNHDEWLLRWLLGTMGLRDYMHWLGNGGEATLDSLVGRRYFTQRPERSLVEPWCAFMHRAEPYIDLENKLLVHGGFDPFTPTALDDTDGDVLRWDRSFANTILSDPDAFDPDSRPHSSYDRVFVGHTVVSTAEGPAPVRLREVWMLDQGAVYGYPLTLMDLDTEEYWQSDPGRDLYPDLTFADRHIRQPLALPL